MYTAGYVEAMRREHDPSFVDIPEPECAHGDSQWQTEDGTMLSYWFEDADGYIRCCHPDCVTQDWYGDYYRDGVPAWAPEYYDAIRSFPE